MRNYFLTLISFVCIFMGGKGILYALPPQNLKISLNASKTNLTIGDSLSIFCDISIPPGIKITEPVDSNQNSYLAIDKKWKTEQPLADGGKREIYSYRVFALSADTLTAGPYTINYITAQGDTGSVLSNALFFNVKGVVTAQDTLLKSNRSPVKISSGGIPLWVIVIVLVIAVLVAAYFIFRKKRTGKIIVPPPAPINEIEEFERIRAMGLVEKGQIKELYILVSNALRGFIYRKMNYDAIYRTSWEIIEYFRKKGCDSQVFESIKTILNESDMVKFAKYTPGEELYNTLIDRTLKPVGFVLEKIENEKKMLEKEKQDNLSQVEQGKGESTGQGVKSDV